MKEKTNGHGKDCNTYSKSVHPVTHLEKLRKENNKLMSRDICKEIMDETCEAILKDIDNISLTNASYYKIKELIKRGMK